MHMQLTYKYWRVGIALVAGLMWFAGCATSDRNPSDSKLEKPEPAREVRNADTLFQKGLYTDAIVACIDIARKDPMTPGLAELQARIMTRVSQLRRETIQAQQAATAEASAVDAMRHGIMPDTYRVMRHVFGDTTPLRTAPTKMQEALRQPVSIHLENVGLSEIVAQIGASQNINMIADDSIAPPPAADANGQPPPSPSTITIHVEKTPLNEVLDYIGRNMNVSFNAGENIIWVTKSADNQAGPPLEMRVYRLRKGLPGDEVPGGSDLNAAAQDGNASTASGGLTKKQRNRGKQSSGVDGTATPPSDDDSYDISIVVAIRRFIPQPLGSDITFDTRSHILLIRNTRENLLLCEDIINTLDVRPIQILIEARFINAIANDTRALGIDWLLGGPVATPPPAANQHPTPHGWTGNKDTTSTDVGVNANLNALTIPDGASLTASADGNTVSANKVTLKGTPLGIGQLQDGAGSFLYQGVLDGLRLKAVLRAMESSKQTRTLTAPRIATVNNKTANIHIGEEFQYYSYLSINTNNTESQLSGTPTKIKLGYKLAVTPSVGADLATINLALVPSITDLLDKEAWRRAQNPDFGFVQQAGKLPIILNKILETEVVVRSGETVVLGGLAQAADDKTTSGLPWFAHLPFIGQLFRNDSKIQNTDNLLIFVTATILSDVGEDIIPLNPREPVGAEVPLASIREGLDSMLPAPMAAAAADAAPAAPAPVAPAPVLLEGVLPPAAAANP